MSFKIGKREVGPEHPPFVIAEIGINHQGNLDRAIRMVDDACTAGCECAKFQCHVVEDEMIPNRVVPIHTTESIWDIMARCALTEVEEQKLKKYVEAKGMIYLCTPFSRAAAERLKNMQVPAYKIGSGECNNYPLVRLIASYGKPVILSTGMNALNSITPAVEILRVAKVPYALTQCTSMYPTPYDRVRLGAIRSLAERFPDAVVGLSDHSVGNYACFAAVALGASILEKHFTSDKSWPGPDISLSIDPAELKDLVLGSRAVHQALGGTKDVLPEEQPTIDFAYACVVSIKPIERGAKLSRENIWVKRPGTGEIKAVHFDTLLGRTVKNSIPNNTQLHWDDVH
jgi:sialic acid synthase SpsE